LARIWARISDVEAFRWPDPVRECLLRVMEEFAIWDFGGIGNGAGGGATEED
jgi:hypothetical protein